MAVKEGLDRTEALRSITVNPARILGLEDRVGALKPGLDADLVIWSGDPLDVMSRALRVFINGREVYRYDADSGIGVTADGISDYVKPLVSVHDQVVVGMLDGCAGIELDQPRRHLSLGDAWS